MVDYPAGMISPFQPPTSSWPFSSIFTDPYEKILELLENKAKYDYKTTIVITMLDLNKTKQEDEFARLREAFNDLDVYVGRKLKEEAPEDVQAEIERLEQEYDDLIRQRDIIIPEQQLSPIVA